MPIFHKMEQGSADWWRIRIGKPTASQFHRIMTPKTRKASTQADAYMNQLIAERLLKDIMDAELNGVSWIEKGKEREPQAAARFAQELGYVLEPIGFVTTNDERIGASPDRLIESKNEALEIKCPMPKTQIGYLRDGPGEDYWPQVQGQMLVGGFEVVHFFAHHPRMPYKYLIYIRDEPYIRDLSDLLEKFCDRLDEETEKAKRLGTYIESDWYRDRKVPSEWIVFPREGETFGP